MDKAGDILLNHLLYNLLSTHHFSCKTNSVLVHFMISSSDNTFHVVWSALSTLIPRREVSLKHVIILGYTCKTCLLEVVISNGKHWF